MIFQVRSGEASDPVPAHDSPVARLVCGLSSGVTAAKSHAQQTSSRLTPPPSRGGASKLCRPSRVRDFFPLTNKRRELVRPLGLFSKLFGTDDAGKAQPQQWPLPPLLTTALIWSSGTSLPIPDWQSIEAPPETSGLHAFWSSAARSWLERLKEQLGDTYHLSASDHFMMLAPKSFEKILKWFSRLLSRSWSSAKKDRYNGHEAQPVHLVQPTFCKFVPSEFTERMPH